MFHLKGYTPVVMISFNLRPYSSFLMMGLFFFLFRAYLNFIHQTIVYVLYWCLLKSSFLKIRYLIVNKNLYEDGIEKTRHPASPFVINYAKR